MICGFFMGYTQQPPLIVLIGPMGAGKTTIGKLLANQLGYRFFDSDHEIEKASGASISWIFDKEGEVGFRQRESRTLDELTHCQQVVLATGGGAVMTPINQTYLKRGIVIYLRAQVHTQYERTRKDKNRPLLQTENPKQKLADLFAIRDPIYHSLADIVITTGYLSPKKMVKEILWQLQDFSQTYHLDKDTPIVSVTVTKIQR